MPVEEEAGEGEGADGGEDEADLFHEEFIGLVGLLVHWDCPPLGALVVRLWLAIVPGQNANYGAPRRALV